MYVCFTKYTSVIKFCNLIFIAFYIFFNDIINNKKKTYIIILYFKFIHNFFLNYILYDEKYFIF